MQSSPTGRGWPKGPGEGETARSWVQFVATARLGDLSHFSLMAVTQNGPTLTLD